MSQWKRAPKNPPCVVSFFPRTYPIDEITEFLHAEQIFCVEYGRYIFSTRRRLDIDVVCEECIGE